MGTQLRIERHRVSVIIYPEDGYWVAQGLQYDITARGGTPIEASERFNDKFGAEFIISREVGDSEPLSGVGSAPREFWAMYENAKMRAQTQLRIEWFEKMRPIAAKHHQ